MNEFNELQTEVELAGSKKTPFFGTVLADMVMAFFITVFRRNGF